MRGPARRAGPHLPRIIAQWRCPEKRGLNHKDGSQDYLETLMTSDEHLRKVCGTYFQQLVKKGYPVDSQYVDATLHILNHQSVLFSTPFYRDLTIYLVLRDQPGADVA